MLRKSLLAVLLAGTASVGQAADWSGFYVGGSVGMGSYSADFNDKDDYYDNEGLNGDTDVSANFGIHAGFNLQQDSFVMGVELAYTSFGAESAGYPSWNNAWQKAELDSTISLKLRAGLAAGNTLMYVAAGPTWAETSYTGYDWGLLASNDSRVMGMTAAVGVEHKFTDAISARLQVEQTSFEESDDATDVFGWGETFSHTDQLSNVSLGVSYNF